MATTAAKNKQDVDKMSAKDRLWDSLDYTYNQRGEKISKEYDKARSAADRTLLSRGMQRSSYGAQTLANVDKQRADALAENEADKIADYENRLQTIEQQELQQSNFERQFAENQRQFNAGQELTRSENALNRSFQTSERLGQQAYQSGENALNRAFQRGEREAQQAWQGNENALNRAQEQAQFDANLGFNRERAGVQDAQWERAFDYQAGRDTVADEHWEQEYKAQQENLERQLAAEYARALLAAEQPVPASLLQQAGLKISGGQLVPATQGSSHGGGGRSSGSNVSRVVSNQPSFNNGANYSGYTAVDLRNAADSFNNASDKSKKVTWYVGR